MYMWKFPPNPNRCRSEKGRIWWRFYVGPARMDVVDETEALQRFFEGKMFSNYLIDLLRISHYRNKTFFI